MLKEHQAKHLIRKEVQGNERLNLKGSHANVDTYPIEALQYPPIIFLYFCVNDLKTISQEKLPYRIVTEIFRE